MTVEMSLCSGTHQMLLAAGRFLHTANTANCCRPKTTSTTSPPLFWPFWVPQRHVRANMGGSGPKSPDLCAHARCAPHLVMISCNMTITHQCAGRRPRGRSQEMTTLAVGNVTRLVKKRSHTSFLPIPPHANHTALIQSALRPAQRRRCADSPQPEGHCPAVASLCLGREGTSIPPIVVDPRRPPPPLHPFFGPFGCLRGT
jgi:hypothetical protein